jgi:type III restriction enzyme
MKLHFEANLDYQMQAVEAVCDLFRGQEVCRTEFRLCRWGSTNRRLYGIT